MLCRLQLLSRSPASCLCCLPAFMPSCLSGFVICLTFCPHSSTCTHILIIAIVKLTLLALASCHFATNLRFHPTTAPFILLPQTTANTNSKTLGFNCIALCVYLCLQATTIHAACSANIFSVIQYRCGIGMWLDIDTAARAGFQLALSKLLIFTEFLQCVTASVVIQVILRMLI